MKIDDRLAKIGFAKVYEDDRRVHYKRYEQKHNIYHTVCIEYRNPGKEFRLQSYDENLLDNKGIGNTNVALSIYEVKLFLKKMRKKERNYAKRHMWF